MNTRFFEKLELNKVLAQCTNFAVLSSAKQMIAEEVPSSDLKEVRERLARTQEADILLFRFGASGVEYFDDVTDLLSRAEKGSTLSCAELMQVNALNRSARIAQTSVFSFAGEEITFIKADCARLYYDARLEDDINFAILSDGEINDHASEKLFDIRTKIKSLNARIRSKLTEYITGPTAAYLQDATVTMRNDRFVIPVKAEYKNRVRGFVHDRSQTGATFFIEPEYVLEMNNELIALTIDEREEVERILKSFSKRFGAIADRLRADEELLAALDCCYAKAQYAYSLKAINPQVNRRGYIDIVKGRHPLIDKERIVPVSVELGKDYNFLLLSGANTGGKTVTLKMVGLFCLMAACGLFIPAAEGSCVGVFDNVFCDLGDSQSIEESLSTFSSHIKTVIEIVNGVNADSLVLIDELGGGTNPDEGQALARAVVEKLLSCGCKGIVTTHFTALKEFAFGADGIENASMEFDSATLKPLYRIKIGMPGSSNALAICRRMGLDEGVLEKAVSYLSEGGRAFENIVRSAEDSRVKAEQLVAENERLRAKLKDEIAETEKRADALERERAKLLAGAKAESRRLINERAAEAEELLSEIEDIFKKEEISESDLIKARTLKNKIKDAAYRADEAPERKTAYAPADKNNLREGARVFVKPMQTEGVVTSYSQGKGEAEVTCGSMKLRCKPADLLIIENAPQGGVVKRADSVKVVRKIPVSRPVLEINVLGLTVPEALYEVDNFIDRAVTDNLEEIKVIHGVGTGKLRKAIAEHLKRHKNVESFRAGKYGEGETGVTFIKLK
ncbi:MAG TPA: endonuclease MutS2 [Candidatus Coproplasma stercorigallinarum]|nr:endonuclease MutS2 [Candidatus Coproplasma stercorigallinarum]